VLVLTGSDDDEAAAPAEPQETIEEEEATPTPEEETEEEPETTNVFSLEVGDCFNDPEEWEEIEEEEEEFEEFNSLPVVPCEQPHDNEIFASLEQPDGEYPGDEEIEGLAFDGCVAEFEPYVGVRALESEFDFWEMMPSAESWAMGDRQVLCALFGEEQKTGSAQGSQE
jgi:hypothetical protein